MVDEAPIQPGDIFYFYYMWFQRHYYIEIERVPSPMTPNTLEYCGRGFSVTNEGWVSPIGYDHYASEEWLRTECQRIDDAVTLEDLHEEWVMKASDRTMVDDVPSF